MSKPPRPVSSRSFAIRALVRPSPLDLEWELEVLPQVAPREKVRVLEDHPDLARAWPGHGRAVEQHAPTGQGVKAGHRPQEGRLAAAARTEDADELTVAHSDRDVLERVHHSGLRLVNFRRALDADLDASVPGAQNQPSSPGFSYCMNSTTAPPVSTKATVRNPSPTSNGSARTSCPAIAAATSCTR